MFACSCASSTLYASYIGSRLTCDILYYQNTIKNTKMEKNIGIQYNYGPSNINALKKVLVEASFGKAI